MAWPVIGRAFSPAEFDAYVKGLKWDGPFQPLFACIHNTATPSLAQRPNGLTRQHILNLQAYYRDEKGWKGGPHLFIDDRAIWVFNDLTRFGTHSPSWNSSSLGIEMLGDYETESFTEGRGRKVRDNTVAAMAALNNRLGFAADGFKFHCEDLKTTHACPGKLARAEREALIGEIEAAMAANSPKAIAGSRAEPAPPPPVSDAVGIDAPVAEEKASILSDRNFNKLNELADQGSRIAQWLRAIKRWFWGGSTVIGGGAATLANTSSGTKSAFMALVQDHPLLFVAVAGVVVAVIAYVSIKAVERYLITAATDGRYRARAS